MASWRRLLVAIFLCGIIVGRSADCAESAVFARGRGHLATKVGNADWVGLRLGDSIPAVSHLRTSPAGVVRVESDGDVVNLAPDTDLDLDFVSRQIKIQHGRLAIQVSSEGTAWTVMAGGFTFRCLPGNETEFSHAVTVGANILAGAVQIPSDGNDAALNAPAEWLGDDQGHTKSSVPSAADWVAKIRRRTQPAEEQGLGQLIAKDAQSGSPVRLEIAQYNVNVVLQAPVALVQIDQSFFNPFPRQEEGTFIFNLPEGASVSRFAMYVTPTDLIEGELIERQKADQVYTSIVRRRHDPAILEQIGTNLFRMRVFPILANDTKRILLDYTVPLAADRGRYGFELPLMSDLKPIWDFGITGVIHPPFKPNSFSSATHPDLKFVSHSDGSLTFSQHARNVQPPPHLLLDYRAAEDGKSAIRSYTTLSKTSEENEQHFVVTLPESARPASETPTSPVDLLVLIDTSGSSGDLMQAKLATKTLVRNLNAQDRFQLGCVDVEFRALTSEWIPPGTQAASAALGNLDQILSLGGSHLDKTVEESLRVFTEVPEGRRRILIYVGDGQPSRAANSSCWLNPLFQVGSPGLVEFCAVKVSEVLNTKRWLETGVGQTGGRIFRSGSRLQGLRDLFEWTLARFPRPLPVTSAAIDGVAPEDLFHDSSWPAGRELHIFGRRAAAKSLAVKIRLAHEAEQTFTFNADDAPHDDSVFTGRLWAQKKLESILDKNSQPHSPERTAAVLLCQEWSLMSPYTAFLVLETEFDYERWGIPRRLRRRYWNPNGAAPETPLTVQLEPRPQAPAKAKPQASNSDGTRREVQTNLDAAKQALANKQAVAASTYLSAVRNRALKEEPTRYKELMADVQKELRRETSRRELKLSQSLVDRRSGIPLPTTGPWLFGFSYRGVNQGFSDRHLLANNLLKPAPKMMESPVPLAKFAKEIQDAAGVPVLFNTRSLFEEGIPLESPIIFGDNSGMTVKSFCELALEPAQITLVPERRALRIMTMTAADALVESRVYPVADLLRTDRLPQSSDLVNPYLADRLDKARKIEADLKKLTSLHVTDLPLHEALEILSKDNLVEPIWFDHKSLNEEGVSWDQPVTLNADNWPIDMVLDEILLPLQLDRIIREGRLVVTTQTYADVATDVRVYSAVGIVDEKALNNALRHRAPAFGAGGGFGGGGAFGGMMGGGGMFGGGGMGGGMVGGMMGGGMMGVQVNGNDDDVTMAEISPPQIQDAETAISVETSVSAEASELVDIVPPLADIIPLAADSAGSWGSNPEIRLIMQATSGRWDDDRGAIDFHLPSFSFVIRQNQRVHAEIAELLPKLRRLKSAATHQAAVQWMRSRPSEVTESDYARLMRLVQVMIESGKWDPFDFDFTIVPHPLTESLVLRQKSKTHEQVEQLFAQLRRARFQFESLAGATTFEHLDDPGNFIERVSLTNLSRNGAVTDVSPLGTVDEFRLLNVRKVSNSIHQRWRRVHPVSDRTHELELQRSGPRLQLTLPDRQFRIEGTDAAVSYPGLTLVELDHWGDAARQLVDGLFPWLPHRSNEEIAALFDVRLEAENETNLVVRLQFPGQADTYLVATISKQTGAIVTWKSVLAGDAEYELEFSPTTVRAIDPAGKELERWELLAEQNPASIPPLDQGWTDDLVIGPSTSTAPFVQARRAMQRGDHDDAIKILANSLIDRPQQPMLNFLFAMAIEMSDGNSADLVRRQLDALTRMVAAGPRDLLPLITASNFPKIDSGELYKVFATLPDEHKTEALCEQLSELAQANRRYDLALAHLDRAIGAAKGNAPQMRQRLARVDLLIRGQRLSDAEAEAKSLIAIGLEPRESFDLAETFARAGEDKIANELFEHYRQLPNLTLREKLDSIEYQAEWLKRGEERWRLLLKAYEMSPKLGQGFLQSVLFEASQPYDAETLGRLAKAVQVSHSQVQLLIRQAELLLEHGRVTDATATPFDSELKSADGLNRELLAQLLLSADHRRATDIVLSIYRTNRLPQNRLAWLINLLNAENRDQDLVEIFEARRRRGADCTLFKKSTLATAYGRLNRPVDQYRATSEVEEPSPLFQGTAR